MPSISMHVHFVPCFLQNRSSIKRYFFKIKKKMHHANIIFECIVWDKSVVANLSNDKLTQRIHVSVNTPKNRITTMKKIDSNYIWFKSLSQQKCCIKIKEYSYDEDIELVSSVKTNIAHWLNKRCKGRIQLNL